LLEVYIDYLEKPIFFLAQAYYNPIKVFEMLHVFENC